MSLRVSKIITYLRPDEAYTLVEFLDQLRDMLMGTYGDEMRAMLQEASQQKPRNMDANDEVF